MGLLQLIERSYSIGRARLDYGISGAALTYQVTVFVRAYMIDNDDPDSVYECKCTDPGSWTGLSAASGRRNR